MSLSLLGDINTFLAQVPMGKTYFGRKAAGNTNVVAQLESGRTIEIRTANKIISFMTGYVKSDGNKVTGLQHDQQIFAGAGTGTGDHSSRACGESEKLSSNRVQEPITYERAPNLTLAFSKRESHQAGDQFGTESQSIDETARAYVEGHAYDA